jgi:hypothetical protein
MHGVRVATLMMIEEAHFMKNEFCLFLRIKACVRIVDVIHGDCQCCSDGAEHSSIL